MLTDRGGIHGDFAFAPDGTTIAATDYAANEVAQWDVATGRVLCELPDYRGNEDVAFSPDGAYLAVPGPSSWHGIPSRIRVWETATWKLLGGERGHDSDIHKIAFAPSGDVLATAGSDRTVRLWDARTGVPRQVLRLDSQMVLAMTFTPDGKRLAATGHDEHVWLWDVESGRQVNRFVGHGQLGGKRALAFTSDGRRLMSWGDDWYLRVFDVQTGKAVHEYRPGPPGVKPPDDDDPLAAPRGLGRQIGGGALLPGGSKLLLGRIRRC